MIKKKTLKTSSEAKREEIAEETETFLSAGHEINYIPYGVSGLDPMGTALGIQSGRHGSGNDISCTFPKRTQPKCERPQGLK